MARWTPFPQLGKFDFDVDRVKKNWARLHQGDAEPLPAEMPVLEAWALFHSGQFQKAVQSGLAAGDAGITVANKAASIYATYLEKKESARMALYQDVARRAKEQLELKPDEAGGHYWQAYALGRYSQGISVAKALAQGLGGKVKMALERTIQLQPRHADAHVALGTFHAEVIDKVGPLIGGMTYGAKKEVGIDLFQKALLLNPKSAIAMIEYANALVMLDGDLTMKEATLLYEKASASKAFDAMEWLDVELARGELED